MEAALTVSTVVKRVQYMLVRLTGVRVEERRLMGAPQTDFID